MASRSKTPSRGMMGIGALVIFIAIIIVAAIAATVLISTGGSLQQKSLITGAQTEEGITSGIEPVNVVASDGSDHSLETFRILVRLQAGSAGCNLNNTVVTIDTDWGSYSYVYNQTVESDVDSTSTAYYNVYYVQRGTTQMPGYLNRGDVAKFIVYVQPPIGENRFIRMKIIPRVGSYSQIEFNTPDTIVQRSLSMWPS